MVRVLKEGHVILTFLIVSLLNSAQTRLVGKVDRILNDLNEIGNEIKQKADKINSSIPVPLSGVLSNSSTTGNKTLNKFTHKEVNVTCTETELSDNKIDTQNKPHVSEDNLGTNEPLISKPSLEDSSDRNEQNQTTNINENEKGTIEKTLKKDFPAFIPSKLNGQPSNNSASEHEKIKNALVNKNRGNDTKLSKNKIDNVETYVPLIEIKVETEKPLNLTASATKVHKEKNNETAKAVYIDLPTNIPFLGDNDVNENKYRDTNVECADTEIFDNKIDTEDNKKCIPENKTEKVLKLTPFIKENKIDEARNACRVDPNLFLGVESYSGYFTVNETYDSNIFFWYFPAEKKPLNETPLIVWLQGGPGASSMTGLFDEIGPFTFVAPNNLTKNPNTWARLHSLLFIDNPVGTGFSFTKDPNGYATDMETYGDHLYEVVRQFMRVFPEVRAAPLFVAGESYAGKYVPALAVRIHRRKTDPWGDINLQGVILGNAYVDPEMMMHVEQTYYNVGLIDKQQINSIKPVIDSFRKNIEANESIAAKNKWLTIIVILLTMSHQAHGYNFLRDDLGIGNFVKYLDKPEIRRAIHVGDVEFHYISLEVNTKLAPEFLTSAKHLYEELLNEYRVLFYCGQLDLMLPCTVMTEQLHSWRWSSYEEFHRATRHPYMHRGKLSGYHKSGGGLTEVVIRGAGHMVPLDQPAPLAMLVARWIQQLPLRTAITSYLRSFIDQNAKNHTKTEIMPFL